MIISFPAEGVWDRGITDERAVERGGKPQSWQTTEGKLQSKSYSLVLFVVIILDVQFSCFDPNPGRVMDEYLLVYL